MKNISLASLAAVALIHSQGAATSRAANLASDNAANYTTATWISGSNGGTGFGSWSFDNTSTAGFFIGDSTKNAVTPPATSSGGINSSANTSFGLFTGGVGNCDAYRPFGGSSLAVGQSFNLSMDTGFLNSGSEGFGLQDSSGNNRLEFFYSVVNSVGHYTIAATSGGGNTVQNFTGNGMATTFTLTGTDTYSFTVKFADEAAPEVFNGTLEGISGTAIARFRLFDFNGNGARSGDTGSNFDLYFNNFSVVPEPATWLAGVGVAGLALLRLRARK